MVTSASIMNLPRNVDRCYPVYERRIDAIRVWPLARINWFFARWATDYAAVPPAASVLSEQQLMSGKARLSSAARTFGDLLDRHRPRLAFIYFSRTDRLSVVTTSGIVGFLASLVLVNCFGLAGATYALPRLVAFLLALKSVMGITTGSPWREPGKARPAALAALQRL
jgi:hypothetical protein